MDYPYHKLTEHNWDNDENEADLFDSFLEHFMPDDGILGRTFVAQNKPELPALYSSSPTARTFDIDYVTWHETCQKVQDRTGKSSKQVLPDKYKKQMLLDFHTVELREKIYSIQVLVKKQISDIRTAANLVNVSTENVKDTKVLVTVNLADVENDENGKNIYKLTTSTKLDNKSFELIVRVNFTDRQLAEERSKTFFVVGKEKHLNKKPPLPTKSSKKNVDGQKIETAVEAEEHFKNICAKHVKTRDLEVDHLQLRRAITSENADVAYHFQLDNDDEFFEEGEIVGFIPAPTLQQNEKDCNEHGMKLKIQKMTVDNANQSTLKGVVSRSFYFEARKPRKGDTKRTETICMMGIVPVQVVGSVRPQDTLYVSTTHPGVAVSSSSNVHQLSPHSQNDATFIGIAFAGRCVGDESSIGLVRAAVSLQQAASQQLVRERMKCVEASMQTKAQIIRKSKRRSRKRVCCFIMLLIALLIGTSILLWQFFTPGSALKYWRCRLGSKKPSHDAKFGFSPSMSLEAGRVEGIEFVFEALMRKVGYKHDNYKNCKAISNGFRFYLNIHRCAYEGKEIAVNENVSGHKKLILLPRVFAIDETCKTIYEYEESAQKWMLLNRTRHSNVPYDASSDFERKNYDKAKIYNVIC